MLDELVQNAGTYVTTSPWLAILAVCSCTVLPLFASIHGAKWIVTGLLAVALAGFLWRWLAKGVLSTIAGLLYGAVS